MMGRPQADSTDKVAVSVYGDLLLRDSEITAQERQHIQAIKQGQTS